MRPDAYNRWNAPVYHHNGALAADTGELTDAQRARVTTVQRDLAWFRSDDGRTARLTDLTSTASLTEPGRDQRELAFQPAAMGNTISATLTPVTTRAREAPQHLRVATYSKTREADTLDSTTITIARPTASR